MKLTAQDIFDAHEAIRGRVEKTPCIYSRTISHITGSEVFLKLENLQFTASFKERGALVKLLSLTADERTQGVIAMSAGNHAQAVAYHAEQLGIPAVIVMPRTTPSIKVENTRAFGAEVILKGQDLAETYDYTERLAADRGLHLVHPYDDPEVIAGQGTVAIEMLESFPDLDLIVVPVGGGGLVSGCALAAKEIKPSIRVIGVETDQYPSMSQAIAGVPVRCGTSTMAEGIAVSEPGRLPLRIVRELVDRVLIVDEGSIEMAVLLLLEIEKTVAEGAGAAGLAALLGNRDLFAGQRVGVIVSGGNIDPVLLSTIIQRGLVRSGRLVRLTMNLSDVPGSLADVTRLISDAEANIVEIEHHRRFTHLPIRSVAVEFVLLTRGLDHLNRVIESLTLAGYEPEFSDTDAEILGHGIPVP